MDDVTLLDDKALMFAWYDTRRVAVSSPLGSWDEHAAVLRHGKIEAEQARRWRKLMVDGTPKMRMVDWSKVDPIVQPCELRQDGERWDHEGEHADD